jgi:hypothetical protein
VGQYISSDPYRTVLDGRDDRALEAVVDVQYDDKVDHQESGASGMIDVSQQEAVCVYVYMGGIRMVDRHPVESGRGVAVDA